MQQSDRVKVLKGVRKSLQLWTCKQSFVAVLLDSCTRRLALQGFRCCCYGGRPFAVQDWAAAAGCHEREVRARRGCECCGAPALGVQLQQQDIALLKQTQATSNRGSLWAVTSSSTNIVFNHNDVAL